MKMRGLRNMGNNCYMNSLLQCLYYIPEMREYFINEKFNYTQELSIALKDVFIGLKNSNKRAYSPDLIRKAINKLDNLFMKGKQADAADLLNNIFSKLIEELGKEDSFCGTIHYENDVFSKDAMFADTANDVDKDLILNKLFNGYYMSESICEKGHIQYTFQNDYLMAFNMKNIGKKTITIYDCINKYQEKKYIYDSQKCQKCYSNAHIFQQKLYRPANYIIFVFNNDINYCSEFVNLQNIDLKGYIDDKYYKSTSYELVGACIYHSNYKNYGHYISVCLNDKKEFFLFNDSYTEKVSFDYIKNTFPYILFYKRLPENTKETKLFVSVNGNNQDFKNSIQEELNNLLKDTKIDDINVSIEENSLVINLEKNNKKNRNTNFVSQCNKVKLELEYQLTGDVTKDLKNVKDIIKGKKNALSLLFDNKNKNKY